VAAIVPACILGGFAIQTLNRRGKEVKDQQPAKQKELEPLYAEQMARKLVKPHLLAQGPVLFSNDGRDARGVPIGSGFFLC
jgi:hypothetical protein